MSSIIDPATRRFLIRLGAPHTLRYLAGQERCHGYANCCHCPHCQERSKAVEAVMLANPLLDAGQAARSLVEPRKRAALPWETDAEAA